MTERIQPKACAVCGMILDRTATGAWIHTTEYVGKGDHVAIPVDYADIQIRVMCDFCFREVPRVGVWTVPTSDFMAPMGLSMSVGHWAACKPCADLAGRRDWAAMVDRHFDSPTTTTPDESLYRDWMLDLYATLERYMIGEPRPWQPGDETVPALPGDVT